MQSSYSSYSRSSTRGSIFKVQTLNGFKSFSSIWLLKFCFCFFLLIQTYHIIFLTSPWNNLYNNIIWVLIRSNRTLNWPQPFLSVFAVYIDSNLCRVPPAAIISHLAPAREYRHTIDTIDSPPSHTPHRGYHCSISVYQDIDYFHHGVKVTAKLPVFFPALAWSSHGGAGWKILVIWVGGFCRWRMEDGSLWVLFLALLPCTITEDT